MAKFISVVLHPLLMPTYLFSIIIFFAPPALHPLAPAAMYKVLLIIFITTFVIPALSIGTLKISAFISDFNLVERRERLLPFLFITCFYALTAYLFFEKIRLNDLIFVTFAGVTVLLILLSAITFFWKISLHSAGIAGLVGFIWGLKFKYPIHDLVYPMVLVTLLTGFVMSSRLKLNAHDPAQVYLGGLIGFLVGFLSFYLFL